jgi:isoaspartyl peptidase/L-asparaginase-like protein (Ntn-hydrolase superfamily)
MASASAVSSGVKTISKSGYDVTPMTSGELEAAMAGLSKMERHVNFDHGTGSSGNPVIGSFSPLLQTASRW